MLILIEFAGKEALKHIPSDNIWKKLFEEFDPGF